MPAEDSEQHSFLGWAPVIGEWQLGETAAFIPPAEPEPPIGLLLAPGQLQSGTINVDVLFPQSDETNPQARIVFGFDPAENAFYAAGLGGYNALYIMERIAPGQNLSGPVRSQGKPTNLHRDETYRLSISLAGQWLSLGVDGVTVLQAPLPTPLTGWQSGVSAWGRGPVTFSDFNLIGEEPSAFVVMQFGEPFDALYHEVIEPVATDLGFRPYRADDVFGPGVILEDIINGIREAAVIIAEITPVNANVFYELGYAYATGKPTILLAERGHPLPFDIQGFRCIFYDDSIGGKTRVEEQLRRHLMAIPSSSE
jgi:hypothetical protein